VGFTVNAGMVITAMSTHLRKSKFQIKEMLRNLQKSLIYVREVSTLLFLPDLVNFTPLDLETKGNLDSEILTIRKSLLLFQTSRE